MSKPTSETKQPRLKESRRAEGVLNRTYPPATVERDEKKELGMFVFMWF